MLTRPHRLVASRLFTDTVRGGRRSRTPTLVLHLAESVRPGGPESAAQVGFVVSRAVGPAVTRNRVRRRLRHIARQRVGSLPDTSALVVRALPAAARASYTGLETDFDTALSAVHNRSDHR